MSEATQHDLPDQAHLKKVLFDYTQSTYWGGPWYPYWSLVVISVFGGLLGLDHFYLRSPMTGLLKCILNVPTLGLWYLYDLIQICGEKQTILKYGLSAPIVGPLGIGAGMFTDDHPGVKTSRSPFRYLAYLCLLFIPFGFDYLVAGDTNGALVKFLSAFIPFLWPIAFFWTIYNFFRAFFMPKHLFDNGMYRFFPFNWFMDTYGLSKLGPIDQPQPRPSDNCDPGGSKGVFRSIFDFEFGWIQTVFIPVITKFAQAVINIVLPGVQPAVLATSAAVQTGATAAAAAATAAGTAATAAGKVASAAGTLGTGVLEAAYTPAVQTTSAISAVAQKAPDAFSQIGSTAASVGSKLNSMATPDGLKSLAASTPEAASAVPSSPLALPPLPLVPPVAPVAPVAPVVQTGGAMLLKYSEDISLTSVLLFSVFAVVLSGGIYTGMRYLYNKNKEITNKNIDDRRKRNDTPPKS